MNASLVEKSELDRALDQTVVFAHQSVGANVLDGFAMIAETMGSHARLIETRDMEFGGPGVYHFKVGENGAPEGKIEDFLDTIRRAELANVDVVLLKFCYLDFRADTDVKELAARYVAAIESMQELHPQTNFAAVTAPLTTLQTGPKAWLKRLLGKSPAGFVENVKRSEFNEILRTRFAPARLFDIALLESSGTGQTFTFEFEGSEIAALDPSLTSDGGHLNTTGQTLAGAAFAKFLARSHQTANAE